MNPVNYLRESYAEIKKITWPSRRQTFEHAALVIGISIALAAFFGIIDYLLTAGFAALVSLKT